MLIALDRVHKSYGRQEVLKDVSLAVHAGERIALVGVNGAGKSTLFRILLGSIEPDQGRVHRKKGLRIGYLPQEVIELSGKTVLEQVMEVDASVREVWTEYQAVTLELERTSAKERCEALAKRQSHLMTELERLGAFDLEHRSKRILAGLGFKEDLFQERVEKLSGGWMMRVALARILLSRPDLLLLDEPTNHLDLDSLLWLEDFLQKTPSALLLISHDRAFLDRVVQKTFELEKGVLTVFPGHYSRYLEEKEKRIRLKEAAYAEQQELIRRLEDFIARNRSRKDRAGQVQSRIKVLENLERLTPPTAERRIAFRFPEPERSGRIVLEMEEVSKSFSSKTLYRGLRLTISRGERIAIVGPNGAGKSTLLKMMTGEVRPDSGRVSLGYGVRIGYFAQHQLEQLDGESTVWEETAKVAGDRTYGTLRNLLAAFLFREEDIGKKISVLSGGEKSRLVILKMLLSGANFLLFDEPTNHLDIPSRDVLEEALRPFTGTVCLITHDRHLINALADKILYLREGRAELFPGNYRDFEELWLKRFLFSAEAPSGDFPQAKETVGLRSGRRKSQEEKRKEAEKRNALFRLQAPLKKRIEELERELDRVFVEKKKMEDLLADPQTYKGADGIGGLIQAYHELEKTVNRLTAEWEEALSRMEALKGEG
jgi:ATP-binding cassette subfamily F protein 3